MESQSILPALIATVTTFSLFVIKDWLFVYRQRKRYAERLLIHCCRSLLQILEMDPAQLDARPNNIEVYIDVYLKHQNLDDALTAYLDIYFLWRGGVYRNASEQVISDAKKTLLAALEDIVKV